MKNISSVKTWIVTLGDGTKFEILAPTRRLAGLNFRFDYPQHWGKEVKSIGLSRKKA